MGRINKINKLKEIKQNKQKQNYKKQSEICLVKKNGIK